LKSKKSYESKFSRSIIPIFWIFFLSTPEVISGMELHSTTSIYVPEKVAQIPVTLLNLILIILVLSLIICVVYFSFSRKLSKINRELEIKNKEIENTNKILENKTSELSSQKERIARELSHSGKIFEILLESALDGVSFYDENWKLTFSNLAFYSIIGYTRESYERTNPSDILHPDDKNFINDRIAALKRQGFYEREIRLKHSDGHYIDISTRSVVVKDDSGKIIGALTISRDITAMKLVHQDLVKANIEAETSNRLKATFLANISHEIRTPLNSVIGFSNLLLSDDLTKETREEYIDHINYNSEKLLQIIGDIIDLSRLESSQMEITYEETSLSEIINEVIEDTKKSIKRNEKPIILTFRNNFQEHSDLIFSDRMWLKRVLTHLLDNAVKFTLEGSVELSYSKQEDNVLFAIKDTGIGINSENLVRIFEEFRQEIDGHHRPFEGLGVGLTLAKEVLEKMGGKIYVKSEKGVGSEFSFTIPYRPAGTNKTRNRNIDQIGLPENWSSKKCLLVDDNKDVLIYLKRILVDTGINVLTARSGPEAINCVKSEPGIDVVILDMQMPEMNGIEATKEIRKIRKELPIIAQTAFIFEDDKDIILSAGCDACLIKPIRKEHLLSVMAGFIK
jgi:PAS domain S-box-containing protein